MTTPEIIQQLVKRFEEHKETYRSGKYNETELMREFFDPFFEALGWDVFNKQGYAEIYLGIDSLIYELYGLSEEEIQIVEGGQDGRLSKYL